MYKTRSEILAEYIIDNRCTIRAAAKVFGISKSSVHLDVSHRLKDVNPRLYRKCHKVLQHNFDIKHLRGGLSTAKKYTITHKA